jgi:hypothetical protein
VRIGSASSDARIGAPAFGGIASAAVADARRTSGSGSRAARVTRSTCAGFADGASSDNAVARTIAGCVASSMTAASLAFAPTAPVRPATTAAVNDGRAAAVGPYHLVTAAAAHDAGRLAWHDAHALGVPKATVSSGRGTLKPWSNLASTTM